MTIITTQDIRTSFPRNGKILALDIGSKITGLAISNISQTLASPRPAMPRTKWKEDSKKFKEIVESESIAGFVIGYPLTLDGHVAAAADAARSYADLMSEAFDLPTVLWDERLTTAAAERALFEQRTGRQKRASKKDIKKNLDSAAAVLILQNFLDYLSDVQLSR